MPLTFVLVSNVGQPGQACWLSGLFRVDIGFVGARSMPHCAHAVDVVIVSVNLLNVFE